MLHTQSFRQWTKHAGTNYLSTSKNTLSITHDKAWWDKVLPKYIFSPCGVNSLGRHFERGEFPWKRSFQSPWLHLWLRVVPSSAFLLSTSQTGSPLRLEQQGEINTLLPPFDMCSYTHVSMPTVLCVCVRETLLMCWGELWTLGPNIHETWQQLTVSGQQRQDEYSVLLQSADSDTITADILTLNCSALLQSTPLSFASLELLDMWITCPLHEPLWKPHSFLCSDY